jgi:aminopeptidase-like protein
MYSPPAQAARELSVGEEMYQLVEQLYPICRSITGEGVRATLDVLRTRIPLVINEVPTGTAAFDWTVPEEWNIRDAYIADIEGRRIIDFARSNLHVMSYSAPVRARMSFSALRPHLITLADRPDWIPYRTSYYRRDWAFCLADNDLAKFDPEQEYDVCIDSSLTPGHLTYGEFFIPGESDEEFLISAHVCHPSLCNDNLSGIAVAVSLARELLNRRLRRYSYRFLFAPATVGAITWLARNEARTGRIRHGLILACVGDRGPFTYKKSRRGEADIDRAVAQALRDRGCPFTIREFSPYGYDERQYCSPGFNLPVGLFCRTPHGEFPEYHTSADGLTFVHPVALADSREVCHSVIEVLEHDCTCLNVSPKCEPQLGKRGITSNWTSEGDAAQRDMAIRWVLNMSDGNHSLLSIAERSGLPFTLIRQAALLLSQVGLLDAPNVHYRATPGRPAAGT